VKRLNLNERLSLSDTVLEAIKSKITSGEWPRGSRIPSEAELQEMFGVSRNTIRGCMQKLSALGVLEIKHGEGTFVKDTIYDHLFGVQTPVLPLTKEEILEMFEFRKILEVANVKIAAVKAGPEDLARLKACVDEMVHFRLDAEKYARADLNFHINIALATQNKVTYQIMLMMKEVLLSHFKVNTENLKDKFEQDLHIQIYEAIKNRDPETAEKVMTKLLDTNIQLLQQQ